MNDGFLLHLRGVHPFWRLAESSQVIIDNGLALPISPLPKLDKKMLHIMLALCPTLLEILFVGVEARAIASHFWNWLYRLCHNKPAFKALLCRRALQAA
jgi:hypothetical protein